MKTRQPNGAPRHRGKGLLWHNLSAAVCGLGLLGGTQAATYDLNDDWQFETNSTLTYGMSWSLENPRSDMMSYGSARAIGRYGNGPSQTADDGRLNFKKGDVISNVLKGFSDFSLRTHDIGAFVRFKYWYDFVGDSDPHFYGSNASPKQGPFKRKGFDDSGKDPLAKFRGFELMDAYVWKNFSLAGKPVSTKLGRQVLSWGEAFTIMGGINSINPMDASAFNRPGAEIKEGLLPVEMLSFNIGLTETTSMEVFYQLKWRASVMDACGSFFSASNVIQPGCAGFYLSPEMPKSVQADPNTPMPPPLNGLASNGQYYLNHLKRDKARNGGQWGIALRKVMEDWNNTELGFYYMNYHSRLSYLREYGGPHSPGVPPYLPISSGGSLVPAPGAGKTVSYREAFPENIQMWGLSFNTSLPNRLGTALSGELSFRPNMPVAYNGADATATIVQGGNPLYPNGPSTPIDWTPGGKLNAWERKKVWQLSLTAVQPLPGVWGALTSQVMAEAGTVYISGLGKENYGRNTAFGRGPREDGTPCQSGHATAKFCEKDGFVTPFSWGYRLRGSLNYMDVLPGLNMTPSVFLRHDVQGYSYDPGGPFQEGQKAVGLGMNFNYMEKYGVDVNYNRFFGTNRYSVLDDRDYFAVSLRVDF